MYNIFRNKLKQLLLKYFQHPWQGYWARRRAKLTNQDIMPQDSFYFLGIVAIFRGEDDYLVEWIEFHKMVGVEHFVLYDNGLEESSRKILQPYIDQNVVTHIPFPHIEGLRDGRKADDLRIQNVAYADCILRFKHHFQYLLQLDIDEFLFPKKTNTITTELQEFESKKTIGIEINWTNFGDGGHTEKPAGLVIENFLITGEKLVENTVKSIANTDFLSTKLIYSNIHQFNYKFSIMKLFTKLFFGYPQVIRGDYANSIFQLNHYMTKSKEEFLRKGKIYNSGWQVGKKTEVRFNLLNSQYNSTNNTNILRFLPALKKQITDL